MKLKLYEEVLVTTVSFDPALHDGVKVTEPAYNTSIIELIEFMAGLPLKDQIYMLANTLTMAGYTQKEIAEALGVSYKTYRNHLWEMRTKFKDSVAREL